MRFERLFDLSGKRLVVTTLNETTDWISWTGAAEIPEPVKTAKRLWVRYRDGLEEEKVINPITIKRVDWQKQSFLWTWCGISILDVIAYRVE